MQRILQPDEIEALDRTAMPRVRLPRRETLFTERAARLRQLADGHAIGDYLRLMATLVDAQHRALHTCDAWPPSVEQIAQACAHGMPIIPATQGHHDGVWRPALAVLLDVLRASGPLPAPVTDILTRLAAPDDATDRQVDALLGVGDAPVDAAAAPFLMAALQLAWTARASALAERDVPMLDAHGVCPVCGTLPVASVVRIGGAYQGLRYLHCALCATEWHMVRVKCTHCESTAGIAYHVVDGGGDAVKAETCDACRTYRKICYQEKDPLVDPVADDLATLALDLLVGEAGYVRGSGNPLLWQGGEA